MRPPPAAAIPLLALGVAACSDGPTARLERGDQIVLEVAIERAETAEERATGLRGADPLGADEGLLLVFPDTLDGVCLDSAGVTFAIDALVVDGQDAVTAIERGIPAGDATPRCHDGVRHILEVSAGVADDAAPGDRLVLSP